MKQLKQSIVFSSAWSPADGYWNKEAFQNVRGLPDGRDMTTSGAPGGRGLGAWGTKKVYHLY